MLEQRSALAQTLNDLPPERREFVFNVLQPLLGKRLFESAPGVTRQYEITENGFTVRGFGGSADVNFRWVDHTSEPWFRREKKNGALTIFIPEGYEFKAMKDEGQSFFYRALKGHSLNPFVKSDTARAERQGHTEADLIHKEVQNEAIRAGVESLKKGKESFLFVGPTGVGKTIVVEGLLNHFVEETKIAINKAGANHADVPKLNFVFADKVDLVNQLYGDIKKMSFAKDVEIVRWGDYITVEGGKKVKVEDRFKTMEELVEFARTSRKPVIVVTVDRTLTNRTGVSNEKDESIDANKITFNEDKLKLLKQNTRSMTVDEAHHAGAPQNIALLDQMRGIQRANDGTVYTQTSDPNRPFQVAGVTATPMRNDMKFIDAVYDGNAFWGYLDTADDYIANGGKPDRSVTEVVKQLERAIERGEAHPVRTQFINPDKFHTTEEEPLFIQRNPGQRGSRFELNPKQYEAFYGAIAPMLTRHDHLFFSCSTVDEAKNLMKHFSDHNPPPMGPDGKPHKMAYIYAGMPDREKIMEQFKKGEITVLFNVGIMDEGIDIPSLTAYIDTNISTPPRELIQRIGRILRLKEGKTRVSEVVAFQKVGDTESLEALEALDEVSQRNWGEDAPPAKPPDPTKPAPPPLTPAAPHEMAPSVFWSKEELKERKNALFRPQVTQKLQRSFSDISDYIKDNLRDEDDVIDPFAPMSRKERKAVDELYRLATSNGREAETFLWMAENAPPNVRHHIKKYLKSVKDRAAIAQNATKLAEYVRAQRPPADEPTEEARAIANAVASRTSDPIFLTEITKSKRPPSEHLNIENNMQRRLANLDNALKDVVAFEKHYGRLPNREAPGYEGRLGEALASYSDIDRTSDEVFDKHFGVMGESAAAYHVLTERDNQQTARAEKSKPGTKQTELVASSYADDFPLRQPSVVTNLETKLLKQVANDPSGRNAQYNPQRAALRKLAHLKSLDKEMVAAQEAKDREKINQIVMERDTVYKEVSDLPVLAKALGIQEKPTLTMTLSGREGAIEELQKFYVDMAARLGFNPPTIGGAGTKTVYITFTAKAGAKLTPQQAFACEEGQHRVSHNDGGKPRVQAVKVVMEPGATVFPTPSGTVRSYDFTGKTPIVVDNPGNKADSQPISNNGDRAADFQRAIGRRLLLVR